MCTAFGLVGCTNNEVNHAAFVLQWVTICSHVTLVVIILITWNRFIQHHLPICA